MTPSPSPSTSSNEDPDEESRALLQRRLALVFTVLAGVSLFYALTQVLTSIVLRPHGREYVVPALTLMVGLSYGALAYRCRAQPRSLAELQWFDAGATLFTCWTMPLVLSHAGPLVEASVSFQLGITYVLLARAILVPSSAARTLAICVVALLPGAVIATTWRVRALAPRAAPNDWVLEGYIVVRSLGVSTFLATLASKVIFGLQRKVWEIARVGQYVLHEKLGEGGMGVVYRATHALLRRQTAVKLLHPSRVHEQAIARFEREVKLMAQLTHPNTVAVFDYGRTPQGVFYYAMEYLNGADLERLVAHSGPLEPGRVIWILEQICRALSEAHGLGLIHRDIKPSNILLCERGNEGDVAKIVDFGLVKDLNATADPKLTHSRALTGTPLYLAPESITAPEIVDARSDLYSLGAVAYFLLVGEPVFPGRTIVEVCTGHLHSPPPALSERRSTVPPDLEIIVLRCLAKQPGERYADASALRDALLACSAASSWNSAAAAQWWRENGATLRAAISLEPTPSTTRIQIDFDARVQPT